MTPQERQECIHGFFEGRLGEPYTSYTLVGRQESELQHIGAFICLYRGDGRLDTFLALTEHATFGQAEALAILAGCTLEPGVAPGPYLKFMHGGDDDLYSALLVQAVTHAQAQVEELGLPAVMVTIATVDADNSQKVVLWYPPMCSPPDHLLETLKRAVRRAYGT